MPITRQQAASNGHSNSGAARIEKLLAYHEQAAAAIRLTLGLLNGHAAVAKTNGHATTLAQALALDGARAAKTKPGKRRLSKIGAQRARTAAVLAAFDEEKPRSAAEVAAELKVARATIGLGPLLRFGYLKHKGGGLVRTAKAYEVQK